jgi:hypothetical protein
MKPHPLYANVNAAKLVGKPRHDIGLRLEIVDHVTVNERMNGLNLEEGLSCRFHNDLRDRVLKLRERR